MRKIGLLLFMALLGTTSMFAQGAKNIKINEVMTNNTASIKDGYGGNKAWIELANISFSTYNVRGMYITTNRDVLNKKLTVPERVSMMSIIPNEEERTAMAGQQHLIFFLDSNPAQGALYLNAKTTIGESLWIALYDANAVDIIDSVSVPALAENTSYARYKDGDEKWTVKGKDFVTPGIENYVHVDETKIAKLKREDPSGIGITVLSMGIVFFCLALLYVAFTLLGMYMQYNFKLKRAKKLAPLNVAVKTHEAIVETTHKTTVMLKDGLKTGGIDKEVYIAVISMALKQYQDDVHDNESGIITIKPRKTNWNLSTEELRGNM